MALLGRDVYKRQPLPRHEGELPKPGETGIKLHDKIAVPLGAAFFVRFSPQAAKTLLCAQDKTGVSHHAGGFAAKRNGFHPIQPYFPETRGNFPGFSGFFPPSCPCASL